jgi:hypothetical protein
MLRLALATIDCDIIGRQSDTVLCMGNFFPLVAAAIGLVACSQEPEYTDQQRVCIAQRYKDFDPKKLIQCVDVCKACMNGTTATCNTSCKLKGAT